jgi:hypothetical protein
MACLNLLIIPPVHAHIDGLTFREVASLMKVFNSQQEYIVILAVVIMT